MASKSRIGVPVIVTAVSAVVLVVLGGAVVFVLVKNSQDKANSEEMRKDWIAIEEASSLLQQSELWGFDPNETDAEKNIRSDIKERMAILSTRSKSDWDAKWKERSRSNPKLFEQLGIAHEKHAVYLKSTLAGHRLLLDNDIALKKAEIARDIPRNLPPLPDTARSTVAEKQRYEEAMRMLPHLERLAIAQWELKVITLHNAAIPRIREARILACRKQCEEQLAQIVAEFTK